MDRGERWLRGLNYARSLNFTDAQYEEALKRIDSPDNANQLLVALIDVSSQSVNDVKNDHGNQYLEETKIGSNGRLNTPQQERESSTSCYSSFMSFPSSSSNQSIESLQQQQGNLRNIFIDGSNVARTHGKDTQFSWLGIRLAVEWFYNRGHRVKVFVPKVKCDHHDNNEIVNYLKSIDAIIMTPNGCNDDLFVMEAARQQNGIVVSNDLYRDEKRLDVEMDGFISFNRLPYIFVDDIFIPAKDPQGRSGATLDEFLRESWTSRNTNKSLRTRSYQRQAARHGQIMRQASCHTGHQRHRSLQSSKSLPVGQVHNNSVGR